MCVGGGGEEGGTGEERVNLSCEQKITKFIHSHGTKTEKVKTHVPPMLVIFKL